MYNVEEREISWDDAIMIRELTSEADKQIKRVIDYIKENEDMFDYMDFKLHDVSYYCYSEMENDFPLSYNNRGDYNDYFYWFCEDEYDNFLEWCKSEYIDFSKMHHQLGRTSKFYLNNFYSENNMDYTFYDLCQEFCDEYSMYIDVKDGKIVKTDAEECFEETIDALEYFRDKFYDDFMKHIEDIIKVYNYIKDFKDNQVEYFKEFMEYQEELLKEELEEEEKSKLASKMICENIRDNYNISEADYLLLKLNINAY